MPVMATNEDPKAGNGRFANISNLTLSDEGARGKGETRIYHPGGTYNLLRIIRLPFFMPSLRLVT